MQRWQGSGLNDLMSNICSPGSYFYSSLDVGNSLTFGNLIWQYPDFSLLTLVLFTVSCLVKFDTCLWALKWAYLIAISFVVAQVSWWLVTFQKQSLSADKVKKLCSLPKVTPRLEGNIVVESWCINVLGWSSLLPKLIGKDYVKHSWKLCSCSEIHLEKVRNICTTQYNRVCMWG